MHFHGCVTQKHHVLRCGIVLGKYVAAPTCIALTLSACSLTANKFSSTGYGHDFVFLAPKDSRLGVPPKKEVFLE